MTTPIRLDDGLRQRVDAARGDVPRERFCRTLISEALAQRAVREPKSPANARAGGAEDAGPIGAPGGVSA